MFSEELVKSLRTSFLAEQEYWCDLGDGIVDRLSEKVISEEHQEQLCKLLEIVIENVDSIYDAQKYINMLKAYKQVLAEVL